MDPQAQEVIEALQAQLRDMKSRLSVETRRLANARYLAESFEKAAITAQLATAEAEARAQRSESMLRYYRETHDVAERTRQIASLTKSISDGREALIGAEGLVRTCASDPIISNPVAGLARRRELAKLQSKVDALSHRFHSEQELLQRLASLDAVQQAVWLAAAENDAEGLASALSSGGNVNAADVHGYSALAYGCVKGHVSIVRLCLEHGGNLSSECGQAHPPLVLAARHGNVEIVRLLLRAGADADGVEKSGQTALHAAAQAGDAKVAQVLLSEGGAFVDSIDSHGASPLHLSLRHLNHATAKVLLEAGADATWKDLHGRTPLEVIPPLPPVARSVVNLREAEGLVREREQRTLVRKMISAYYKGRGGVAAEAAVALDAADGVPEDSAEGLPVGATTTAAASESRGPAHLTMRTFKKANVRIDQAQQRTYTRKTKGEGFLQRANGKSANL